MFFIRPTFKKQSKLSTLGVGLTDWEKNFLKSIEGKECLSIKQSLKLKEITEKTTLRGRKNIFVNYDDSWSSSEYADPRFNEIHGVSYDDVHNFDR